MRSEILAGGLELGPLDPVGEWAGGGHPRSGRARDGLRALLDFNRDELFDIARALEVTAVTAIFPSRRAPALDTATRDFQLLCSFAARHGIRVGLEFMPFSGVPDLTTAWAIVSGAGCANGGLVFDTWHYLRGRPDPALLQALPGERIFEVQVSDVEPEQRGELVSETMTARRLPEPESGPLVALVRKLVEKPGLGRVGLEVMSSELWSRLSAQELGRECARSLERVLAVL